jgi:hypothetical protein
MKKTLCILLFIACLFVFETQCVPLTPAEKQLKWSYKPFTVMGWFANTNNMIISYLTLLYCFEIGIFSVVIYNDGGQ